MPTEFWIRRGFAVQAEDMGTIQLDECNTVQGRLQCGNKFDIFIDSGASITLLSSAVVQGSPYLRSLPPIRTNPVRIRTADGSYIVSDYKIQFEVEMQKYFFVLNAHIMPTFGLVKALLGTADLKELGAKLDFKTNQLDFELCDGIPFQVLNRVKIRAGEARLVELTGKLPNNADSGEIVLQSAKKLTRNIPACLLTSVVGGVC